MQVGKPLRVLLSANPEWGGVMPCFPLADALRDAGHIVLFSGPPPNQFFLQRCGVNIAKLVREIESRGFEYVTVFQDIIDHPLAKNSGESVGHGSSKCWMGLFRILEDLLPNLIDDLERVIHDRQIDVVLVDAFIWYEAIAAVKCNIPVISVKTNLRVPINCRMPPSRHWLVPSGLASRARILLAWAKIWVYWHLLLPWSGKMRTLYRSNRLIRKTGAKVGLKTVLSDYFPEFVLPELTLCPETFDFFAVPGRTYTALVAPKSDIGEFDWPQPVNGRIRVYCSAGTLTQQFEDGTVEKIIDKWLTALAERADMSVLLQVSDTALRASLKNVPGNTTVVGWVSQRDVLDQADLAIIAGGLGTIKECIAAGVPMLVSAPTHADKPGNAMRTEFHRIGRQIDPLKASPEEMSQIIDDLVRNRDLYRANMRPIQAELQDPAGPERLVRYVEAVATRASG
ncbi:MAG: glycosyltransferase [Paracoccaceae bacterium]